MTATGFNIQAMLSGEHGQEASKLATFLTSITGPNLDIGLVLEGKTYMLTDRSVVLLAGASGLSTLLTDPRIQPLDISAYNNVCCLTTYLPISACAHDHSCLEMFVLSHSMFPNLYVLHVPSVTVHPGGDDLAAWLRPVAASVWIPFIPYETQPDPGRLFATKHRKKCH
jgi:hypothetical protein